MMPKKSRLLRMSGIASGALRARSTARRSVSMLYRKCQDNQLVHTERCQLQPEEERSMSEEAKDSMAYETDVLGMGGRS
jgi:hypothetical protein